MNNKEYSKKAHILIVLSIISAVLEVTNLWVLQWLIDAVMNRLFPVAFCVLLFWGICCLVNMQIKKEAEFKRNILSLVIEQIEGQRILDGINKIPYHFFEEKTFCEKIDQIKNNYKEQYINSVENTIDVIICFIRIFGLLLYLFLIKWWIVCCLIIIGVPIWLFSIKAAMREGQMMQKIWPMYYKQTKFSEILNSREYGKEARIFQFQPLISNKWEINMEKFYRGQLKSNVQERMLLGGFSMVQYAITILIIVYLIFLHLREDFTIGMIVAIADAMWQIIGNLQWDIVTIIRKNKNFTYYLKIENEILSKAKESNVGIEIDEVNEIFLDHVWFRYQQNTEWVIRDVSIRLSSGKKWALVGENGCGKSTLIKLILGLLEPQKGKVFFDGIEASKISMHSRYKVFSCIFQDFVQYNMSLEENIKISRLNQKEKVLKADLVSIIEWLEMDFIQKLPYGLQTKLGKIYDEGVDLSGGEWQKIAVARALYSEASCIIMDEPTSRLDPIVEKDFYKGLLQTIVSKTLIVVTHRMGFMHLMDEIIVLKSGKVIERGSHKALLEQGGYYAELYEQGKKLYE